MFFCISCIDLWFSVLWFWLCASLLLPELSLSLQNCLAVRQKMTTCNPVSRTTSTCSCFTWERPPGELMQQLVCTAEDSHYIFIFTTCGSDMNLELSLTAPFLEAFKCCCVIKVRVLQQPVTVSSLRHTSALITLFNHRPDGPHLPGGWVIMTPVDFNTFVHKFKGNYFFCMHRKTLRCYFNHLLKKMSENRGVAFIFDFLKAFSTV